MLSLLKGWPSKHSGCGKPGSSQGARCRDCVQGSVVFLPFIQLPGWGKIDYFYSSFIRQCPLDSSDHAATLKIQGNQALTLLVPDV